MKRSLVLLLTLGLVAGALSVPAHAKAKPVTTTLYLHGGQPAGEMELPDTWTSAAWLMMDTTKPTAATPKSMFVTNYLAGPNTTCSGNGLVPTWRGMMSGTVTGTLTITLHTVGSPAAQLQADVFPDGNGGCESTLGSTGYTPPVATGTAAVPPGPGTTTFTFKNVKFKAAASLVIMLSIPGAPANPYQVRVLYDGAGFESNVQFSCAGTCGKG
jgi:hypothetical protein